MKPHHLFDRFLHDRKGSVAIIFSFVLCAITLMISVTVDYGMASRRRNVLQQAADAAAVAAVSGELKGLSTSLAQAAATNVLNANLIGLAGTAISTSSVSFSQSGLSRTAMVSVTASSNDAFGGILRKASTQLSVSSTATASIPPNLDIYMLLDNSPSMALPATTAGINTMIANTKQQDGGIGCAFACHQSQPNSGDTPGNPTGVDNYALAKQLGVVTRIQNMASATNDLANTASSQQTKYGNTYRMAVYSFTSPNLGNDVFAVQSLTTNLSAAGTAASAIDVLEVCKGNYVTCSNYDDSTETDFLSAMTKMNSIIPNPGAGVPGASPQEVLFIVTDGVEDKKATSCAYSMIYLSGFNRCIQPFDITMCSTIKQRGVKIAVLYTEYYPLGNDSFYSQYVGPFQSQIGSNLQSCASSGLFFTVTTNQDISSAMNSLFQAVAQPSPVRLLQ
jgi:Flp pilus assembly protein TadG